MCIIVSVPSAHHHSSLILHYAMDGTARQKQHLLGHKVPFDGIPTVP